MPGQAPREMQSKAMWAVDDGPAVRSSRILALRSLALGMKTPRHRPTHTLCDLTSHLVAAKEADRRSLLAAARPRREFSRTGRSRNRKSARRCCVVCCLPGLGRRNFPGSLGGSFRLDDRCGTMVRLMMQGSFQARVPETPTSPARRAQRSAFGAGGPRRGLGQARRQHIQGGSEGGGVSRPPGRSGHVMWGYCGPNGDLDPNQCKCVCVCVPPINLTR